MICTFALVVIMVLGNGSIGLISMVTRSWAATGCARWSEEMGCLADSKILSASARATRAKVSTRASRWGGARAWQDGGADRMRDEGRVILVECRGGEESTVVS